MKTVQRAGWSPNILIGPNDTKTVDVMSIPKFIQEAFPLTNYNETGTDTPSLRERQWQNITLEPTIANQWQYPVIYNRMVDCRGLNCPYPF